MGRHRLPRSSSILSRAGILLLWLTALRTAAFVPAVNRVALTRCHHPYRTSTQLHVDNGTFLRWRASKEPYGRVWDMQTAVATFEKRNCTLFLYAMLHYGTPGYFEHYNGIKTTVLYELLVDESLLTNHDNGIRRLKPDAVIQATAMDRTVAAQYGWACQADSIRYDTSWIHADLSTQEFLQQLPSSQTRQSSHPLWKAAATNRFPTPALEAATALTVGPPFLSTRYAQRRLFSNLFVPGSAITNILRALLWFTVPCPELSILLLDWSSLTSMSVSQITMPLVETLAKGQGQFSSARQLLFGQVAMLASRSNQIISNSSNNKQNDLLITQRNQRAMQVIRTVNEDESTASTISLLYGCNHCPDLQRRLIKEGYKLTAIEWRTAWSVRLANGRSNPDPDSSSSESTPLSVAFLLGLPLYLIVGAIDWISTLSEIIQSHDLIDVTVLSSFYLLRHAVVYSTLSKYVLDWDDSPSANPDVID